MRGVPEGTPRRSGRCRQADGFGLDSRLSGIAGNLSRKPAFAAKARVSGNSARPRPFSNYKRVPGYNARRGLTNWRSDNGHRGSETTGGSDRIGRGGGVERGTRPRWYSGEPTQLGGGRPDG